MVDLTTRDRVTIALSIEEGRMPLTFFIHTVDDLRKLLSAIEEAQLGEASHTQWEVDTDRIQIAASVNGVSAEDLENIIHDAYQSLKATDAKDEESIPNSVNEQSRRLTRSIVKPCQAHCPSCLGRAGTGPSSHRSKSSRVVCPAQSVSRPPSGSNYCLGGRRRGARYDFGS